MQKDNWNKKKTTVVPLSNVTDRAKSLNSKSSNYDQEVASSMLCRCCHAPIAVDPD